MDEPRIPLQITITFRPDGQGFNLNSNAPKERMKETVLGALLDVAKTLALSKPEEEKRVVSVEGALAESLAAGARRGSIPGLALVGG